MAIPSPRRICYCTAFLTGFRQIGRAHAVRRHYNPWNAHRHHPTREQCSLERLRGYTEAVLGHARCVAANASGAMRDIQFANELWRCREARMRRFGSGCAPAALPLHIHAICGLRAQRVSGGAASASATFRQRQSFFRPPGNDRPLRLSRRQPSRKQISQ